MNKGSDFEIIAMDCCAIAAGWATSVSRVFLNIRENTSINSTSSLFKNINLATAVYRLLYILFLSFLVVYQNPGFLHIFIFSHQGKYKPRIVPLITGIICITGSFFFVLSGNKDNIWTSIFLLNLMSKSYY